MEMIKTNAFSDMSMTEMQNTDGGIGVVLAACLIGGGCLVGGFAVGYGLAYWLG